MLALVNTPNGSAPIELREVPDPRPADNEALVEIRAFSLNRGELSSFARNKEGWIPGQDVAGVVTRQAANGEGPPAGARVVALMDQFAWRRVLIPGAAGGVGTLAVQIAARSGAHVTAVIGRPDRAAGLKELGATEVVEGVDNAQGRFALVLESAGGRSLAKAIQLVEPKGTIVVYGNSSTEPTTISFADFRGAANARIQSFSYFTSEAEERFGPDLALLVSLIADGSLKPRIGAERSWRDILPVADQLRERRIAGKAVLLVDAR